MVGTQLLVQGLSPSPRGIQPTEDQLPIGDSLTGRTRHTVGLGEGRSPQSAHVVATHHPEQPPSLAFYELTYDM